MPAPGTPPRDPPASPQGLITAIYNAVKVLGTISVNLAKLTGTTTLPATPTLTGVLLNQGAAGETPLTHYQEGTWTPTLTFGGAAVGMTGTFLGTFTRIGREVICRFRIVLTAKGSSVGAAVIGGLPALANADPTNTGSGGTAPIFSNMAGLASFPHAVVNPGTQTAALVQSGAAADATVTDANFTTTSVINGEFRYFV